ncbi:MAG: HAMP domain-containing histidine kinase [Deltaproteobacteria bacterium]|nr:HAMP domain-containing histidine kinase [Deltaproteobacteria bacterium]
MLFGLILVGTVMLYRLARVEARYRRELDRWLDLVTHELKTPLAGVRTLLQSMALGRVPEEERPRLLNLGRRNVERLEHLVQNILIRNRMRRRRLELRDERIGLGNFTSKLIEQRVTSGVAVHKPVLRADEEVVASADPDALRVILDNLLDNAEKYGRGDKPVCVDVRVDAGAALVEIADSGQGIAKDDLERIFHLYFRAGGDPGGDRGSGLGLAISRDLAERMGGSLTARSEGRGKGAIFSLRLRRNE